MTDQNLTPEEAATLSNQIWNMAREYCYGQPAELCSICEDVDALAQQTAALQAEIERLTKERDEAQAEHRFTLGLLNNVVAERDQARSMLAEAERDMRQRAAELVGQEARTFPDDVAWGVEDLAKAILALPLKHSDREGV